MIPARNALESVEIVELTSLVNMDVESRVQTRWERKQQEQQHLQSTPRKKANISDCYCSPSKSPSVLSKENVGLGRINGSTKLSQFVSTNARSMGCATPSGSDRFIPTRSALDFENASYAVRTNIINRSDVDEQPAISSPNTQEFRNALQTNMGADSNSRILAFKKKAPAATNMVAEGSFENPLTVLYSQQSRKAFATQIPSSAPTRALPSASSKILDAPGLLDDFYTNPLDWSCANQLAVALGPTVYIWTASTGKIDELMAMENATEGGLDHVSSVKFVQEGGGHLAIGSSDKTVDIWDVERGTRLRRMKGHASRVSALSWNKHILTSGGRDAAIFHHDVRAQNHIVSTLKDGHVSEVCSVKWNDDGNTLATGGNDNVVCLWDARGGEYRDRPRLRLTQHQAAVKAMAWCPYQRSVLATGGGTNDRCIKIWNSETGHCTQSVDTGSQVCSLLFNPNDKEILSSHGFSNCELALWKFPNMAKIKDFNGHTNRVLHTTVSPDGSTVCSAAADESLRFWEIFGQPAAKKKEVTTRSAGGLKLNIR